MSLTPFTKQRPRPPLLLFVSCLVILVGLTGFLGYAALRNGDTFNATTRGMQQQWAQRLNQMALPNQPEARAAADIDNLYLNQLTLQYRKLHRLFAISVTCLGVMVLVAFFIYRYALVMPLRTLINSCKELTETNLRSALWGMERTDLYGDLARAISDIRKNVATLTDMTVEGPEGTHLVRFSGRGSAVFNTLLGDLQAHIRTLQEGGETMRQHMETQAETWQRKVQSLEDVVMKNSGNLHEAVETSRQEMQRLNADNSSIRLETQGLVDKFKYDLDVIGEITAATGQRVAQTLSTLSASDRDIKQSTEMTLKSSETFSKHAADLTEKLVAATTLMRASGKVMMETTEAARTRFLEAVKSLETQDQTLRAFLGNTADKTEQIASLYDSLSGSTHRVHETVDRFDTRMNEAMSQFGTRMGGAMNLFDTRMGDFVSKSDLVLGGIAASGTAMSDTSFRLQTTHDTMAASLEAMRGHTDMMAQILGTIRDDYAGTMASWHATMGEAGPAIAQLKEAGDEIKTQLQQEWTHYGKQSHALLVAMEQDARGMHARAEQVAHDMDALTGTINSHSAHLGSSASQFDLQVANLSQRIEAAASSVLRSNEGVTEATTRQIGDIHIAVSDLMQRLGILTQLTSTLGGVAGQLGALVPVLSDLQGTPRAGISMAAPTAMPIAGANPALAAQIEQIGTEFGSTMRSMRTEFDSVRSQISRWVDTLSTGYQRLAQQIGGIDAMLESKFAELRVAAPSISIHASEIAGRLAPSLQLIHETLADEAGYNMRMGESVETLRADLGSLREQITSSSGTLQNVSELLAQGFSQLLQHEPFMDAAPHTLDVSRVESASAALERLIDSMQGTSFSLIEKLERVTQELDRAVTKIEKAG